VSAFWRRRAQSRLAWAVAIAACALALALRASSPYVLAWSWPPLRRAALVKLEGRVESVAPGAVTIAGYDVALPDGLLAPGEELAPGDWTLVHAERDAAGNLIARQVVRDRAAAAPERAALVQAPVEFEGRIEQLSPREDGLGDWVVDGVMVRVGAGTVIHGQPALGAEVELRGQPWGARGVLAAEVWVVAAEEQSLVVEGRIARISREGAKLGALALSDGKAPLPYALIIDEQTFIDESRGRAEADMWAEVRAVREEDGTLRVLYVRILRP